MFFPRLRSHMRWTFLIVAVVLVVLFVVAALR